MEVEGSQSQSSDRSCHELTAILRKALEFLLFSPIKIQTLTGKLSLYKRITIPLFSSFFLTFGSSEKKLMVRNAPGKLPINGDGTGLRVTKPVV